MWLPASFCALILVFVLTPASVKHKESIRQCGEISLCGNGMFLVFR